MEENQKGKQTMMYLLYDNECPFCCNIVKKISGLIDNPDLTYHNIKSTVGQKIVKQYSLENVKSVIYIDNEMILLKSNAILHLCKQMSFPYNLFYILNILPESLLNIGYNFIAKNRMKIKL